jgi:2-amino-4-hydroxy-6-hydroxymethyldihydropteridine diphosphokinase
VAARRVRTYIGLGANLGDAEATLTEAVHALAALPGARLRGVSPLYATVPWGMTDQPEFRNAVVALDVPTTPDPARGAITLLAALKDLERAAGRVPSERWGPRVLDLDILTWGRDRVSVERPPSARSLDAPVDADKALRWLEIPHPEIAERLFVLAPLADLAPDLIPPGWRGTVESARRRREAAEGPDVVRVVGTWDGRTGRWR